MLFVSLSKKNIISYAHRQEKNEFIYRYSVKQGVAICASLDLLGWRWRDDEDRKVINYSAMTYKM